MKKILFTMISIIAFATVSQAQTISKNAIGVRLGEGGGFGAEVNYQRALNEKNRLEFGLSARNITKHKGDFYPKNEVKLIGIYQWVWNIDGGLNWYTGPGVGVGHVAFNERSNNTRANETFAFAAGDIGMEYNFDFPLLISIDLRPELGFGDYRNDVVFDVGLSARYQF
jgi:hypothetical protein